MTQIEQKLDEFQEDREELLETLNDLDILISPSKLRLDYTEHNNYHNFQDYVLGPLIEKGRVVKVPNSTKGDLIQTPEKVREIMEDAINEEQD
jgi:hypothetical protein